MKRRPKETDIYQETGIYHEQHQDQNEGRPSRLQKALAIVTLASLGGSIAAGIQSGMNLYNAHKALKNPAVSAPEHLGTTKTDPGYRRALEHELRTAYKGPVAIDQAENTGKTTMKFGDKRGIINFHIDGSGRNTETAESVGTPDYHYGARPHGHLVSVDGKPLPAGAITVWKSNQEAGDAVLYPRLANFSGSKPKTFDYKIDLEAEGLLEDGHELQADYDAGDILVTGSNGKITSIDVQQRSQNEPPVEITES